MRLIHCAVATGLTLAVAGAAALLASNATDQLARRTRSADPYPIDSARPAMAPCQHGLALMAESKASEALPLLEEATGADPRYAEAWTARGECERRLGAHADAAQSCRRALDLLRDGEATMAFDADPARLASDAAVALWRAAGSF